MNERSLVRMTAGCSNRGEWKPSLRTVTSFGATISFMVQSTKTSTAATRRAAIERTRGMLAHLAPGISLSDELIADRRAEAQAENREAAEEAQRLRGRD
jgi:hypothetical protein